MVATVGDKTYLRPPERVNDAGLGGVTTEAGSIPPQATHIVAVDGLRVEPQEGQGVGMVKDHPAH